MGSSADTVLRLLARRWIFLVVAAVIGGGIGVGISATRPTQFASSAFLLGHATGANPADSSLVASSAKVYAKAATDPGVIGAKFRDDKVPIDPNRADQYVTAIASPDTPLLEIKATTNNAAESVLLANSVATAVATYSHSLSAGTGYEMQTFRTATPPTGAVGPGAFLFGLAGALLAMLGVVIAVVVIGEVREQPGAATAVPVPVAPITLASQPVAPPSPPLAPPPVTMPPSWPNPVASIPRISPRTDTTRGPDGEEIAPRAPWQIERGPDPAPGEARRAAASGPTREGAPPRETGLPRQGVAKREVAPKPQSGANGGGNRKVERAPKLEPAPEPRPSAEG